MAENAEPVRGLPEVETREGVLPDGTRIALAVKRGMPQDEVDLLALKLWQEVPEN